MPQGAAIGHSGQVEHAGLPITSGERYILVGFVSLTDHKLQAEPFTAEHVARKFGGGGWDRGTVPREREPAQLWPGPCFCRADESIERDASAVPRTTAML